MVPLSFLCLVLLLSLGTCKVKEGKVTLSPTKPFEYVDKFAFNVGMGNIMIDMKLDEKRSKNAGDVTAVIMIDDEWEDLQKNYDTLTCKEKIEKAKFKTTKHLNFGDEEHISRVISQFMRPHVWYVYLAKCDGEDASMPRREAMKKSMRVQVEVTFLNEDDSHFSFDDTGLLQTHCVITVVLLGCGIFWLKKINRDDIHPIVYMLLAAILCEFASNVCEILHLSRFAYNGYGWKFFDFFHYFFLWSGKLVVSTIFILCAWGWTITTPDFSPYAPVFIPLCLFIAMAHLMLVLLAYLFDKPEKHHDHETVPGTLLIIFRIVLWLVMVYGTKKTLSGFKVSTTSFGTLPLTPAKRSFLLRFTIFASIWFLALPIITMISGVCAAYVRHMVVSISVMCVQTLSLIILAHLFLSPGEYKNVSTISGGLLGGF